MTSVDDIASRLAEIVGATYLSSAPADVGALGGLDPLAVVWPASPSEVAGVLKLCGELGVAVGVTGHGTRVTRHWPVADDRRRVALDTRRLNSILEVDETSRLVKTQTGILVRHLEEALHRQGLTLGPFPSGLFASTLGGLLAAPPHSAHTPRTGWVTDGCLGLEVVQADGSIVETRVAPRRATGPDLARLYLGSRGGLGVITTAVLRVYGLPEQVQPLAFAFPGLDEASRAVREVLTAGVRLACARVLGERMAREELGEGSAAAVVLVLWGPAAQVARQHRFVDQLMPELKGIELPQAAASRWWERRSSITAPREPSPGRVGTRQPYGRLREALGAVAGPLARLAQHVWIDQFTMQGASLWLSARAGESGRPALAAGLLDAGLDPLRLNFPPLMPELRARLDPRGTLVVMES